MSDNQPSDIHWSYIVKYGKQAQTKPQIEDIIVEYFDGAMKESVLSFVSYMRENKMKPVWAVTNGWKAIYKSKVICYIRLYERKSHHHWCDKQWYEESEPVGSWNIVPHLFNIDKYQENVINEELQNIVWNNLSYCKHCFHDKYPEGRPCSPGISKTVLGKEFILCGGRQPLSFTDPDEKVIDCIKTLLELEQKARYTQSK